MDYKYQVVAKLKLIPPELIINGREIHADNLNGANPGASQFNDAEPEAYRKTYYPLGIDKFTRIVLKHLVGSINNDVHPQTQQVIIDRYLVYLTVKEDALVGSNPGRINQTVSGYYEARTFYKPLYDTPKSHNKPDYRTTIHWEPNIVTDEKGEATVTYYNAAPTTTVRIVLEGITDKGVPIYKSIGYDVK